MFSIDSYRWLVNDCMLWNPVVDSWASRIISSGWDDRVIVYGFAGDPNDLTSDK